ALAKEIQHAKEWVFENTQPMPGVLVRAHCHYYAEARGTTALGEWIAINVPGLQGLGSRYGARKCTGVVHFGMVLLTIEEGRVRECRPLIARPQSLTTVS
ncbi:unnamed protein product, partial [marine sediment metagenome]